MSQGSLRWLFMVSAKLEAMECVVQRARGMQISEDHHQMEHHDDHRTTSTRQINKLMQQMNEN